MTVFDLLLILVLGLSIGFAVVRGAVREFATLAALGGAGLAAYLLFNPLLGMMGLKGSFFGMVGVGTATLLIFFVLFYAGFHFGLRYVELTPALARADRIGGGVFGFLRGFALIGLSFLGYAYYLEEDRRPAAVNDALLLPFAQGAASFFESLAPRHDSERIISPGEIKDAGDPVEASPLDAGSAGYERGDRAALDEIVTTATTTATTSNRAPDRQNPEVATRDALAKEDPIASILAAGEDGGGGR